MTDRQTDRQNYDPQNRASIAASRGNNSVLWGCLIYVRVNSDGGIINTGGDSFSRKTLHAVLRFIETSNGGAI